MFLLIGLDQWIYTDREQHWMHNLGFKWIREFRRPANLRQYLQLYIEFLFRLPFGNEILFLVELSAKETRSDLMDFDFLKSCRFVYQSSNVEKSHFALKPLLVEVQTKQRWMGCCWSVLVEKLSYFIGNVK
jgi:hypothetical protein